jgi:hypothetical protein
VARSRPAPAHWRSLIGRQDLDPTANAGGPSEPLIGREQRASQELGERHVRGIVGRDVGAKLVRAPHQRQGRIPPHRQAVEIVERGGEAPVVEPLGQPFVCAAPTSPRHRRGRAPQARRPSGAPPVRGRRLAHRLRRHWPAPRHRARSSPFALAREVRGCLRETHAPAAPRLDSIEDLLDSRCHRRALQIGGRYCCRDCPRAWLSSPAVREPPPGHPVPVHSPWLRATRAARRRGRASQGARAARRRRRGRARRRGSPP